MVNILLKKFTFSKTSPPSLVQGKSVFQKLRFQTEAKTERTKLRNWFGGFEKAQVYLCIFLSLLAPHIFCVLFSFCFFQQQAERDVRNRLEKKKFKKESCVGLGHLEA